MPRSHTSIARLLLSGCLAWLLSGGPGRAQEGVGSGRILSLRTLPAPRAGAARDVAIEVAGEPPLRVRDQRVVLRVGARELTRSRYGRRGRLLTLVFRMPARDFAVAAAGAPVLLYFGSPEGERWELGRLDKRRLDR